MGQTDPVAEDNQRAEAVDRLVRVRMQSGPVPGLSLAVVRQGKLLLAKGYGLANLELSVPATDTTSYSIASITKTFTAIATMLLVEEGKLGLDQPLSTYRADVPAAWKPVTIRQLLSHVSGIRSFAASSTPPCNVGKDVYDTPNDLLAEVACLPLDFPPGDRWVYGDTNYLLLGLLIEAVSKGTYEDFLRERVFVPLGMNATRLVTYTELIPNRADGYAWRNGAFRNAPQLSRLEFSNGGLVSTVHDMARLDIAFTSETLLKRATLEQMWTNARLNGGDLVPSYGLGLGLTRLNARSVRGSNQVSARRTGRRLVHRDVTTFELIARLATRAAALRPLPAHGAHQPAHGDTIARDWLPMDEEPDPNSGPVGASRPSPELAHGRESHRRPSGSRTA
jgi:CubicO group peptidase (beta-lactamase class C family)